MNMRFLHSLACWLTTLAVVVVVFGTNRSQNPQAIEQGTLNRTKPLTVDLDKAETSLVNRIVVALDVRTNDHGDLVVTKGDQYDVRENHKEGITTGRGCVRNLGKPVALAQRYYEEGGDEIAFLNITSFRQGVIEDMPMLQVLEQASKNIFVPLTVGGGIRSYTDPNSGQTWSALEVASRYFRAGADKVRQEGFIKNIIQRCGGHYFAKRMYDVVCRLCCCGLCCRKYTQSFFALFRTCGRPGEHGK